MQKLKTGVFKDDCNPEWNEELTLYIRDVNIPIHLVSIENVLYNVMSNLTGLSLLEQFSIKLLMALNF